MTDGRSSTSREERKELVQSSQRIQSCTYSSQSTWFESEQRSGSRQPRLCASSSSIRGLFALSLRLKIFPFGSQDPTNTQTNMLSSRGGEVNQWDLHLDDILPFAVDP